MGKIKNIYKDSAGFANLYSEEGKDVDKVLEEELGEAFPAYRDLWNKASNFEIVPDFPIHLDFQLNYSCNMKCPMCDWSWDNVKGQGKRSWVPIETFHKIIDDGVEKGLKAIGVNWGNEPLIRPDLPEFVAYASQKGVIDIFLHTNGMLLSEDMSERLIDAGVTRLGVSLDAHTQETYDKIRIGGDLEKVHRNIFNFLEIRERKNRRLPVFSLNFVQMPVNTHELDGFLEFWRPYADYFAIQNLIDLTVKVGNVDDAMPEEEIIDFRCGHAMRRGTVMYDGSYLPCCISSYAPQLALGNIRDNTVSEFWNSDTVKELQRIHTNGEYYKNPVCRACVSGCRNIGKTAF